MKHILLVLSLFIVSTDSIHACTQSNKPLGIVYAVCIRIYEHINPLQHNRKSGINPIVYNNFSAELPQKEVGSYDPQQQYRDEDQTMCKLFDKLYDPKDPTTYKEITQEVSQLSEVKSRHPKLVDIIVKQRGLQLFNNIQGLDPREMPPQFSKKKKDIIDNKGRCELLFLYQKIKHKFKE